jgi:4-amino-4-deoxy-L-arabinose transferase-like glycosyltransferase
MNFQPLRVRLRERRRTRLFVLAAVVTCVYAGLLRFEALVANYGHLGQPRWSRSLEAHVVPLVHHLRPASIVWGPVSNPYVGGDPINYIRYAREMRHFYQAHVREPMFLAITRAFLWLSDGREIAVSYASAFGSMLAVLATCALGAVYRSRTVGILAGLALATEFQAIAWGMEGWRDDTFMMFVTFAAAAFVILYERPSRGAGVVAGLAAAAATLTRITALTFVVPALLWVALFAARELRREARRAAATAALVSTVLVAPYLINCWRETGDPFYALNYHTKYYRAAEGQPSDEPVGALAYASAKLVSRPVTTLDTAAHGLISVPFSNKWTGWTAWHEAVGPVLKWSAAAGMAVAIASPRGRLLLLVLFASLIPYALTWSVGGGGEWRFTQHVYPMYLVLAFTAIAVIPRAIVSLVRKGRAGVEVSRTHVWRASAAAAAIALVWLAYWSAPVSIARETLATEGAVSIVAGDRDAVFFTGDWSDPIPDGANVTVRVAQSVLTSVHVPLRESDYTLTLRMDPPLTPDVAQQPRVTVFVNRRQLAQLDLTRNRVRMGTYRMRVPREAVSAWSRIDLLATHTVPAGDAGEPFESLAPHTPVAFRLWYVRLERK